MTRRKITLGVSLAAVAVGLAPMAAAQDVETSDSHSNREAGPQEHLDVITVTATKRSESQQDVGLSIAAFTSDNIRERGVNDAEGIINLVPGTGFTEPDGGGIPVIIIRGVGLQNFRINDTPTTAIYVDEVYQTSVASAVATIFDVERVEVLKGPQGGLYGRNAVGGAIQVISARPNFDEYEGYASVNYEQYNRVESEAVLSGPITEQLAFRIGGKVIKGGGYFYSTTGDFNYGDADRLAARALLEYRPADNINFFFKVHGGNDKSEFPLPRVKGAYQALGLGLGDILGIPDTGDAAILNSQSATASIDNICPAVLNGGSDPANCETLNGMTPDELGISSRYDSASPSRPGLDNKWWGASLQADVEFGAMTITSITAYDDFNFGRYIDQDVLPEVHQEIDYSSDIQAWSQELRLSFDNGGRLNWLIGANYAEDELKEDTLLFTETGLLRAILGGVTRSSQDYRQTTDAYAVFGRADWAFADQIQLIVEARYTEEKKGIVGGTFLPQVDFTLAETDDSTTYDALSGKVAIEYSPTSDALIYASYSEGFKSGGYFGGFATNSVQLEPFDQEEISAFEIGFKTDWPNQSLRLNGSAFYYDRRDVQANGIDTTGIVNIARLTNVGDVEVYGFELETVWSPIPQFTLQGGFSWLKNEIVESNAAAGNFLGTDTELTFVGARLPNQPELSANAIASFEEYIGGSMLGGLQVAYTFRGEQDLGLVLDPRESAFMTEDSYHLVNLRATIGPDDRAWTLSVYVDNVFDEEYRSNAGGGAPGGFLEIYGAPRIVGGGLEVTF